MSMAFGATPPSPLRSCAGPVLDEVREFQVIDCQRCGFKHVHPLPTTEELEAVYRHEYYVKDKPCMVEHQREDADWWRLVDDRRLARLEREAPGRDLLDVGCGIGRFVARAAARGWSARGLEPSRQAAVHAKGQGLRVEEGFLDAKAAADLEAGGKVDVVTMHEVLEHVPDPLAVVRRCARLLAPGGILAVSAPNDYSPLQDVLRTQGAPPWWVAPPHHLNFFDFGSLRRLLEAAELTVIHEEGSFPMEMFLLMGDNYLDNPELGRACHAKRKRLELGLARADRHDMLDDLGKACAVAGIGRTIWMLGRNPRTPLET